mmetsp:Transcript_22208/g.48499  ORF Transcript_22208/g.48499 Transcript_22208/m.48499 type:complete len:266 (-) Transcript_22208:672-1469(-)
MMLPAGVPHLLAWPDRGPVESSAASAGGMDIGTEQVKGRGTPWLLPSGAPLPKEEPELGFRTGRGGSSGSSSSSDMSRAAEMSPHAGRSLSRPHTSSPPGRPTSSELPHASPDSWSMAFAPAALLLLRPEGPGHRDAGRHAASRPGEDTAASLQGPAAASASTAGVRSTGMAGEPSMAAEGACRPIAAEAMLERLTFLTMLQLLLPPPGSCWQARAVKMDNTVCWGMPLLSICVTNLSLSSCTACSTASRSCSTASSATAPSSVK